jgi:molybdate transport repressor ModE-like protein
MKIGPLWLKLQIACGDALALGPGKADLLDAIKTHGSISAAGRALGMSYRRAWLLVDEMNRCFDPPVVETLRGYRHPRPAGVSRNGSGGGDDRRSSGLCAFARQPPSGAAAPRRRLNPTCSIYV